MVVENQKVESQGVKNYLEEDFYDLVSKIIVLLNQCAESNIKKSTLDQKVQEGEKSIKDREKELSALEEKIRLMKNEINIEKAILKDDKYHLDLCIKEMEGYKNQIHDIWNIGHDMIDKMINSYVQQEKDKAKDKAKENNVNVQKKGVEEEIKINKVVKSFELFSESDMKARGNVEIIKRLIDEKGFSAPHGDFDGLKPYDFRFKEVIYQIIYKGEGEVSYSDYSWKGLIVELLRVMVNSNTLDQDIEEKLKKIRLGKLEKTICISSDTNDFGVRLDSTGWHSDVWPIEGTDIFVCTKFKANQLVEMARKIINAFGYQDKDLQIRTLGWNLK